MYPIRVSGEEKREFRGVVKPRPKCCAVLPIYCDLDLAVPSVFPCRDY